jgi:enterochelin esterase-like enzyme
MRGRDHLWDAVPAEIKPPTVSLDGNAYIDDVVKNMLPTLDQRYGVKLDMSRTAIAGSSMGGLASLYAMGRYPNVFGAALAYSTHWPIGGDELVDWLIDHLPADGKHMVWTDRGDLDLDATYESFHERAIARLEARGFKRDRDFIARVEHGTGHCEDHWARRVEVPINWWNSRR